MHRKSKFNTFKLTYLAILAALVVVLQLLGSFIHLGAFSVSLVLIPIVLGAVIGGPLGGVWLGAVFGVTVLLSGDAAFFLGINPVGTVVTVMVKGIACGAVAGWIFPVISRKNKKLGVFASAVLCPVVNTGVFLLGCLLFFMSAVREMALAEGVNVWLYMLVFFVGGNFLFELAFNAVLSPVILRLIRLIPGYNDIKPREI